MPKKPYVFIGSSKEGLDAAKAIQLNLDHYCETQIWYQGLFGLSDGTLENLVKAWPKFDFAILVMTGDDLTISRETEQKSPRDNVVLELGLFIGGLGRDRVFIVVDRSIQLKLPSDLAGITPATFDPPQRGNYQTALGAASTLIENRIKELGIRETKSQNEITSSYENDLAVISTYLQSKNLTMITFAGLTKHIDSRFNQDYISRLIATYPTKITRANLKGNQPGIKILNDVEENIDDNIPTEIKDSIIKYKSKVLANSELERFLGSLFSNKYSFFTVDKVRKDTSIGAKRILELLEHLTDHGFAERKVAFNGKDAWRLLKNPIRIYSATYTWPPNGQVDVTERIKELVSQDILQGPVDPSTFGIGDPIYGTVKTLRLHYRIHGKEKGDIEFKDGQTFVIK